MSPQPQLASVSSVDDRPLAEPISPELVLVDPALAERARAALEHPPAGRHLGVASSSPPGRSARELPRVVGRVRPQLPTLPNRPAGATPPRSTAPAVPAERPAAPSSPAAGATVIAPAPPARGAAQEPERVASTDRGGTSITVLLFGIAVGLLGGIMAADAWMPREPTFVTAPPVAASGGERGATERGAVAAAPSVSGPKRGRRSAPKKAAPTTATKKPGTKKAAPKRAATRAAARKKPATKQRTAPTPEPRNRASVSPPAFVWVAVPGASRYEVVFERGGKVVYSATTRSTRLKLPRSWRYDGKTYRLEPGRYRWTVWPIVAGNRGKPVVSSDYTA